MTRQYSDARYLTRQLMTVVILMVTASSCTWTYRHIQILIHAITALIAGTVQ